ncbi:hypothetical protein ABA45_01965 [Marinobacter psychrophilus]|uniref:DUF4402 domain-containing protein n=1 Tax=Marinobacter psychrophilus TaxID=330734 RepID=A0A0H4I8G7_9GAMM|nr:DUF4402 domain-containing protein [Marinobacter psychrophilus]AKO51342.1 hypothetical protein ABA45_01965 [Marinobacter psychrophilus]
MNSSIFFNRTFRFAALASVVAVGAFGASNSFAAKAASSNSSATVIVPIEITKSADLVFGKFAPGAGGTVTVATDGARTTTGPILSISGSTPTAAKFDVTGDDNSTYGITWSGDSQLTGDDAGTSTMALSNISDLTAAGATTDEVGTGTLSGSGAQSIYLGGKLTVASDQPDANYTGDVTATVEYN